MTETAVEESARRFGWIWLTLWATAGVALEAAHGFKLAPYLDDELARSLLRWAHAHGVGISLVILVWSVASPVAARTRAVLRALSGGAIAIPLGFALGAFGHPEGDPSVAIFLVPAGALSLLCGLAVTAWRSWRA